MDTEQKAQAAFEAPPEYPPHVIRMYDEKQALDEKTSKLNAFTLTDKFLDLPLEDQYLLHIQHSAMATYAIALTARISRAR